MPALTGEPHSHKAGGHSSSLSADPVDKYAPLIIRGSIIATGVVGVVVFARSIRLFTKFYHVRQIPSEFVKRNMRLRGVVDFVRDDSLLLVDHTPIARLPFFRQPKKNDLGLLKVQLAGIEVGLAGQQFMFRQLQGRPIKFTLIRKASEDVMQCEVFARRAYIFSYSVNRDLVRRGYARVPSWEYTEHLEAVRKIPEYSRLYSQLLISEKWADRRGVGVWQRESWAERLFSYPSQVTDIVRNSGPVRAVKLTYLTARDVINGTIDAGKRAYIATQYAAGKVQASLHQTANFVNRMLDRSRKL